jgi:hypothetical protein
MIALKLKQILNQEGLKSDFKFDWIEAAKLKIRKRD